MCGKIVEAANFCKSCRVQRKNADFVKFVKKQKIVKFVKFVTAFNPGHKCILLNIHALHASCY